MKRRTFWMALAALAVIRLALMATVPVFEPSEARYATLAANMARSGDFVVPRFMHNLEYQSFDGKPPLVFQAGGLFCRVLGVNEFAVRLTPFFSAALLLLILYHAVRRFSDAARGRLAVLICVSCTAFYAAAGIAMTDMTLACCIAGSLLLYHCFLMCRTDGERPSPGEEWAYAAGVAVLLGAGMMTKGPIALVKFGLPVVVIAAVTRCWKGIFCWKWLAVAPIFLLIAVPWFVLVEQRNPGSVWYFFYNENFLRFVSHDYGDRYGAGREAFRGVAVLWVIVTTLPWALIPLWDLVRRLRARTRKAREASNAVVWKSFSFLSFAVIVAFWCLTSRVLVYYLFPAIPMFASFLALHYEKDRLRTFVPWGIGISVVAVAGVLIGGTFLSDRMQGAKTPFSPVENHYAYEFYHGRKPDAELAKYRRACEEWRQRRAARKAAEAAK